MSSMLNQIEKEFVDVIGKGDKSAVDGILGQLDLKRSETDQSDKNETSVGPAPKSKNRKNKKLPSRVPISNEDAFNLQNRNTESAI